MKSYQYSVRVYEVHINSRKDEEDFKAQIEKNYELLKNRLIVVNGIFNDRIKSLLDAKNLKYIHNIELTDIKNKKESKKEENRSSGLKIVNSIVRSGQEIVTNGDLLILNRVNSGAMIKAEGNLIATKVIEGNIECNGNFMLINASKKANVIFNGIMLNQDLPKDIFCKIELLNDEIVITVMKKEFNWV